MHQEHKHIAALRRLLLVTVVILLPLLFDSNTTSAMIPPPDGGAGATSQQSLVVRVYFGNNDERDQLASELDVLEMPTTGGYVTALADQATYDDLLKRGLRVEIDGEQTREVQSLQSGAQTSGSYQAQSIAQQGQSYTFFDGYLTVEGIEAYLDREVSLYPSLAEKVSIGETWCKAHPGQCTQPAPWNGYNIWALHITNRAIPGPKPVFWYEAGIHSREIATSEMAMRFIDMLLNGYASDADAHWLVDWHDIWVVPLVNPDGHHIVEAGGGGTYPYLQRKNADDVNGCSVWPPSVITQFGTDLNRNFPFLWGCCRGSSTAPCLQDYRGTGADSEVETQAIVNKVRSLIPDQRGPASTDAAPITTTGIMQDMHSFAGLNLYPWGSTTAPAPNGADLENIAAHMSATDAEGNGYRYCQPPSCLYATDGSANDWGYGELGIPSITTELTGTMFLPAYPQVTTLWDRNRGMLTYMAKIARTPYLTTRGPDANDVTVAEEEVVQGSPAHLSATLNYAWSKNLYVQNVAGAEYYIDTPPWAGGTPLPMKPSDGALDSPTEKVEADIDTTSLSPGRHIVLVRGRGIESYAGLPSWGAVSAAWLRVVGPQETTTPSAEPDNAATDEAGASKPPR